jgi:hypothetical protein
MFLILVQVVPSSIVRGYNYQRTGIAQYLSRGMDQPISRNYTIHHENMNKIVFTNGLENFYNINNIGASSLVVVRVDMKKDCIALFVKNTDDF